MIADIEEFAFGNGIDNNIVSELFSSYVFSRNISDDDIRQKLLIIN